MKAEETFKMRDFSGDLLAENFEREFKGFKLRVGIPFFLSSRFSMPFGGRSQAV
jgi:hypothetical protein